MLYFFSYLYAKKRYDSFSDAKTSKSLESSKDYAKYLYAIYLVSFQINLYILYDDIKQQLSRIDNRPI